MKISPLKLFIGFLILFLLYHAAEYMILFRNDSGGFLTFQILFFIAAWMIARWQFKEGLAAWGLSVKKTFMPQLLTGMIMGIILYGLTYTVNLFVGIERKVAIPEYSTIIGSLLRFIFGNFFSSFSEDVLTRGYLYRHLNGKVNIYALVVISAAVYLFNHIYRLGDGPTAYLYLFLLGVIYVIPLILTKKLWFTGGMHWAGNCFFYFTHNVVQTVPGQTDFTANYTLCICIVLMIPVNYYVLKTMGMVENDAKAKVHDVKARVV